MLQLQWKRTIMIGIIQAARVRGLECISWSKCAGKNRMKAGYSYDEIMIFSLLMLQGMENLKNQYKLMLNGRIQPADLTLMDGPSYEDIKEMKDVFESTESELDELEKQNELLKDQLLEAHSNMM
ncbi:hypothetical protein Tco_0305198 [Tanacetum coccineum]